MIRRVHSGGVLAVQVAAGVDLRRGSRATARSPACTGRRRRPCRRARRSAESSASSACASRRTSSCSCSIRSGVALGGGLKAFARRLGPRRRVRAVIARRQPFEDPRDRDRDPVSPAVSLHAELARLAAEVLAIVRSKPRRPSGSWTSCSTWLVVDPQRHRDRLRCRRPQAAEHDPDHVLAVDRHAVDRVERVRQAQAGDVVVGGERLRVAAAAAVRAQARQRRLRASAGRRAPGARRLSAAVRYFSISTGDSDSTSAMLSKP